MRVFPVALVVAGTLGLSTVPSLAAPSQQDRSFAEKAAQGGTTEVMLGQLAQQKAKSEDVKQFGQRMVQDHSQANQELQQIAKQQNLSLPTKPGEQEQATIKRLHAANGAAFDTAYVRDMVADHKQDVALFQKEAQSGQDPALKQFAQKTLPVLQSHLQMVEGISQKMGTKASGG